MRGKERDGFGDGRRVGDGRAAWVHAVRGEIGVNAVSLKTGDAAYVSGENLVLTGSGAESNEILLFDLG